MSVNHTYKLAPRIPIGKLYNGRWINKSIDFIVKFFKYKYLGIKYAGFLPNEELNEWLYASDIVFIQRKEILNSGNVRRRTAAYQIQNEIKDGIEVVTSRSSFLTLRICGKKSVVADSVLKHSDYDPNFSR